MSIGADPREFIERTVVKLEKLSVNHTIPYDEKEKRMRKLIAQISKRVETISETDSNTKAELACWMGKAYGCLPQYTKDAEEYLAKAIKLNPGLIDAWNCLGSEYWKKPDLKAAEDCFRGALEQKKNKVSLRKLSMVVRNFGDKETYGKRLGDSIKLAKDAIAMDVKDGESWYILGNAYMSSFFETFSASDLEGCLKAYEAAERSSTSASKNPDLFFNRANIHNFYERYQEAIDGYSTSIKLDPKLPGKEKIDSINRFVKTISKTIDTKNRIKAKKLQLYAERIPKDCQVKDKTRVELSDMKLGENKSSFFAGIVISPVKKEQSIPVSFLVMDRKTDMCVVSIYGVTPALIDKIKISDVIYINNPALREITLTEFKDRTYRCITIKNPATISVNGNALPPKAFAKPVVRREMLR
ncbi:hypothetical protein AAMO2058_001481000 [Amorphochlora amoebiformis]|uniref:Tetratricopeptide repeat protein 5 OB fold domain-containing protein n=1 Tax=Amorphochlora amoebiformis TaxID=1561963 RepID=A0A7S0GUK3_9EUKA|mmetsp:Transcript_18019/g.28696  ORF Transcript_18019/g.28696 Transcript_18019/m.28696 type:complete len:414 (+) Transcript_18019:58-1299(+)